MRYANNNCRPRKWPNNTKYRSFKRYTPILVYGKQIKPNTNLGIRKTYADISATILDLFNLSKLKNGTSFKNEILK